MRRRDMLRGTAAVFGALAATGATRVPGLGRGKNPVQSFGRSSARLSDRRRRRESRQKARTGDRWPAWRADVRLDAAWRREGGHRTGAGRRHPTRPHQRRRHRTGDRRSQCVQSAVPVPQYRAYAEGDRWPDRPGTARQGDRQRQSRVGRPLPGWMRARGVFTTPSIRSKASPISRASKCASSAIRCSSIWPMRSAPMASPWATIRFSARCRPA